MSSHFAPRRLLRPGLNFPAVHAHVLEVGRMCKANWSSRLTQIMLNDGFFDRAPPRCSKERHGLRVYHYLNYTHRQEADTTRQPIPLS